MTSKPKNQGERRGRPRKFEEAPIAKLPHKQRRAILKPMEAAYMQRKKEEGKVPVRFLTDEEVRTRLHELKAELELRSIEDLTNYFLALHDEASERAKKKALSYVTDTD